jgi:hypothetical protein
MKDLKKLRFIDDDISEYENLLIESDHQNTNYYMNLLSTSLKISPEITPAISDIIESIIEDLGITNIFLECYVYCDAEVNARCFTHESDKKIIIMLSSGLVNTMTKDELAFVIGHELGHFLFGHLDYSRLDYARHELLDMKMDRLTQAQEISADRIGLICAGSVENAIRAIVKTVSGLKDEFISLNLHNYLHQIQSLQFETLANNSYTHPIFPIRAKALMLFSMSEPYYWWNEESKEAPVSTDKLNAKIRKDLESTTLKNYKDESNQVIKKFKLWFFVKSFIDDEQLDNDEIEYLHNEFGYELANKAIVFAQSNPKGVNKKYDTYRMQIEFLSQDYKMKLLNEMKLSVSDVLFEHSIHRYFSNFEKSILRDFK